MDERSRQPRSKRWQYAIIGACFGGLVVGFLALAFRGPTVISINNGCCCGLTERCVAPLSKSDRVGKVDDSVPRLPTPEIYTAHSGTSERYFPFVPFGYGNRGGSGGGRSGSPDEPAVQIDEPPPLLLIVTTIAALSLAGRLG